MYIYAYQYNYRIDGKPNGGTGFIGHIPSQNLSVLLTNNHVLPTAECAEEASFTFGYKDEGDNKGTTVAGDELLDTKQWWTNSPFVEHLVCLVSLASYMVSIYAS